MTAHTASSEQFTGLILLTGQDRPGVAASLFEILAPFAVHVIDLEQIVINKRLILTVLIGANPAHQSAIEEDLATCALALDVDIATLFSKAEIEPIAVNLSEVLITSPKLRPNALALVAKVITESGANIESIARLSATPVSIRFTISEGTGVKAALTSLTFEDETTISIHEM